MKIVEFLESAVKVVVEPEEFDGELIVTNVSGEVLLSTPLNNLQSAHTREFIVPYGAILTATYGKGNRDVLYVPGDTPDKVRTAATRRFPGISVGV